MFSPANTKLKKLYNVAIPELQEWLLPWQGRRRKIYSLDLLSGHSCPFAKECLSKAIKTAEGIRIQDGKHTKFRCYSASQEVSYPNVYRKRSGNLETLEDLGRLEIYRILVSDMPDDAGIIRIHSAGDFFNLSYFDAWVSVAHSFPGTLFYAYTKAIPFWLSRRDVLPPNLSLTASYGGTHDHLIEPNNLKSAIVVENEEQALDMGLEVDYTDEHAAVGRESFALVIHGIQPKKEG